MQKYTDVVTSARSGAAIPNARVTVKAYPSGTTATIYSDDGITEQDNPITTDARGEFSFYAADGRYSLTVSGTGITEQTLTDHVLLADPDDADPEQNAADVAFAQSGTGAVSRTMQDKGRDDVHIFDFIEPQDHAGIIAATDSNDHATAITNAIAQAKTAKRDLELVGTLNLATGLTIAAGSVITVRGQAREAVKLLYSGTGTALTVGDSATDTTGVNLQGFVIECTGVGAGGLAYVRTLGGFLRDVYIQGRITGSDSGTGLSVQGTGNYAGNMDFTRVRINGNWTKGAYFDGPSTNTNNNHSFRGVHIARTTTKPGTGTIGFHWGENCGDSAIMGVDVEGYDTAYDVDGRHLCGVVRAENNTTGIALGATSVGNHLLLQGFTNTTNITDAGGTFNFVVDHIGMSGRLGYPGGDNRLVLRSNSDQRVDLDLYAGSTAEKEARLRFLTMAGALAFQWKKNTLNDLILDDGTNTIVRIVSGASAMQVQRGMSVQRATPTYGTTVAIDARAANQHDITVTDGVGFTISNPTNPAGVGQEITIRIINTSGGAVGAITWGTQYKLTAWTSPATSNNRSIKFQWNGTNWVEATRTAADVPN